jgi:hypothetical protein
VRYSEKISNSCSIVTTLRSNFVYNLVMDRGVVGSWDIVMVYYKMKKEK